MKNERYTTNPTTINYEYDSFLINDLNLNLLFNNNSNNPSLVIHEKQENKGNDVCININKKINDIKNNIKDIKNSNNNINDDSVNNNEYITNKRNSKQQNSIYLSSLNSENLFDTQLLTQLNINQFNKNKYFNIDTRRNSKEHIINQNGLRNNNIKHRIDHGSTRRNSREHIVNSNSIRSSSNKEPANISNGSPNSKKLSNNHLSNFNSNSILDTQLLSELYNKQYKYNDNLNKVIKPKDKLIKEEEFKDLTLNSILNRDKFDVNKVGVIRKEDTDNRFNKLIQNEISTGVKAMTTGINNNKEKKKLQLFNELNKNSNSYRKGNPNIQKENINNINVDIKQKKNSILINEINNNSNHDNRNLNDREESSKMNYNTQQKEKLISVNKINKKQNMKQKSNQNSEKENINMNIDNNRRESENLVFNSQINEKYIHDFQETIPINNIKEEKKKEAFTIPNNNAPTFELQSDQRKLHYQKIITQLEKMNISNQDLKDELKINKYKKLIELLNKINLNSIINLDQYDLLKHQLILDKFNKFKNVIENNGKEEGNVREGSGSGKSNSRSSLKNEGNNKSNIKDSSNNSVNNINNSNSSIKNSDNTSSFKSNNKNHIKNKVKLLKLPIPKSKDEYEYINKNHIKINYNNNNNTEINNSNKDPNLLNLLISKGSECENEKDRSRKNDVIINDYESMNSNLCFLNLSVTKFEDGNDINNYHDFKNQNSNLNQRRQYNNIKHKSQDKDKDKENENEINTELLDIYEEISIDYLNNINPINNPLTFNSNVEFIKNILLNIQFQLINMNIMKENKRDNIKEINKLMKKLELIHKLLVKL
ncbi:hypothetical protein K502DRAFT_329901 [Neoconidiobolus thromboides FSU 785]|nr:hypothetical protein K502DRAFT_329901 [Neoconidiobolus thromboides FSU 785]